MPSPLHCLLPTPPCCSSGSLPHVMWGAVPGHRPQPRSLVTDASPPPPCTPRRRQASHVWCRACRGTRINPTKRVQLNGRSSACSRGAVLSLGAAPDVAVVLALGAWCCASTLHSNWQVELSHEMQPQPLGRAVVNKRQVWLTSVLADVGLKQWAGCSMSRHHHSHHPLHTL